MEQEVCHGEMAQAVVARSARRGPIEQAAPDRTIDAATGRQSASTARAAGYG
jgi:hypothetical protein